MDTLTKTLYSSQNCSNFLNEKVDGLPSPKEEKLKTAYCLFHIAIEYFESTIILVERQKLASARVLMRPFWDAHIRGAWLMYCAMDDDFKKFQNGCMLSQWKMEEAIYDIPETKICLPKKEDREILHGYVHGGAEHIDRYINEQTNSEHAKASSIDLLVHSSAVACLAAHSLAMLCDDQTRATEIMEYAKTIIKL